MLTLKGFLHLAVFPYMLVGYAAALSLYLVYALIHDCLKHVVKAVNHD